MDLASARVKLSDLEHRATRERRTMHDAIRNGLLLEALPLLVGLAAWLTLAWLEACQVLAPGNVCRVAGNAYGELLPEAALTLAAVAFVAWRAFRTLRGWRLVYHETRRTFTQVEDELRVVRDAIAEHDARAAADLALRDPHQKCSGYFADDPTYTCSADCPGIFRRVES